MNELSKHQLLLVALLISFVTSLATGISVVSIMDQHSPASVVQTISQVIERTINATSTPETQMSAAGNIVLTVEDQVANAVSKVSNSFVYIKSLSLDQTVGMGLIVSKKGTVVTDKSLINPYGDTLVVFPDGKVVPMAISLIQTGGDLVFLAPKVTRDDSSPAAVAGNTRLGQTVYSIYGNMSKVLSQGMVSEVKTLETQAIGSTAKEIRLSTDIPNSKVMIGGPLFDVYGNVIGLRTSSIGGPSAGYSASNSTADGVAFYATEPLKSAIANF